MLGFQVISDRGFKYDGSIGGDEVFWIDDDSRLLIALIDAIGSDINADIARVSTIKTLKKNYNLPLEKLVLKIHTEISNTVGCQIFLAEIDKKTNSLHYFNIGNINAVLIEGSLLTPLTNLSGVLGKQMIDVKSFYQELNGTQFALIVHSDGISKKWMNDQRKFYHHQIQTLPDVLRLYKKTNDDFSFIVLYN